jgi:hypothetical protein
MKRYLLSVFQPGEVPPAGLDMDEVSRDVAALQDELKQAGAWVFAGSLHPPSTATVVRSDHGDVLMTDGPFSEAKEYIGGFTVISAPDLDAALAWGRKAAAATTLPVEVRPFRGDD